jgi:hypothetical protein
MNQRLNEMFILTPLERFARFFMTHTSSEFLMDSARKFFNTYDDFLGLLEDSKTRDHLDSLSPERMDDDLVFQGARAIRTRFQEAVNTVFLRPESPLYHHTISRGVF